MSFPDNKIGVNMKTKKKTVKKPGKPAKRTSKNSFFFVMSPENKQWLKTASVRLGKPQNQMLNGLIQFAKSTTSKKASEIFGK